MSLLVKRRPLSVLQSREEVEVTGRQVGTVGGVVQVLPTEGGNMVDHCCCRVGSHIIQHTRTPVLELLAPSPHHMHRHDVRTIPCLLGTHYSIVLSLTQHCASTACAMKVVHPTSNEEGCLWTQNTVTPHQFYVVPGNKMGKLIFRLSYVHYL
jgi:hypothetical protein